MKVMDARTRYSTSNLPHSYFEMQGEMEGGELSAAACGPSPVMKLEVAENGVEQATSRNGRRSKQCLKSRHPSSFALPFMSDALSLSLSPSLRRPRRHRHRSPPPLVDSWPRVATPNGPWAGERPPKKTRKIRTSRREKKRVGEIRQLENCFCFRWTQGRSERDLRSETGTERVTPKDDTSSRRGLKTSICWRRSR